MDRRATQTITRSQPNNNGMACPARGKPKVKDRTMALTEVRGKNQATVWKTGGRLSMG